jgi:molybdopterin-containing oxidoreductase family membrane subunit
MNPREENLLRSITVTTWKFYAWVGFLCVVLAFGAGAYIHQLRQGLVVTGMRDQVSWGLYITNFVFFIGISHAGTLISAILRVTDTGWRRPITRLAEAITVFALCIGGPMVIVDMGRPDRMLNLFRFGRIQSPIVWDVIGVSTYLTGCILYFYLPLIPDLGILAASSRVATWRKRIYRTLSLGWTGSETQKHLLEKAISIMAIFIIPLAVSVHTVVSWIFAMTLRPGWDSSIFGPYFVIGAIYSGAAGVILSMYVLRRIYHLEDYIETLHFRNLGLLLLSFCLMYLYFNVNEYFTAGYKLAGGERVLLERLFTGDFAPIFWSAQILTVILPLLLMVAVLGIPRYRGYTIPGVVLSSGMVVIGAWVKRYIIVVPTLRSPYLPSGQRLPWEWSHYRPTWVEWTITAAAFAAFLLIYTLLAKLFPVVSFWETRDEAPAPVAEPSEARTPSWWRPGVVAPLILMLFVLLHTAPLAAATASPQKKPVATSMAVEWSAATEEQIRNSDAEPQDPNPPNGRVYLYSGNLFNFFAGSSSEAESELAAVPIAITATLRDAAGIPVAFQPVEFSLKTLLGTLSYGTRATQGTGQVKIVLRDRRRGTYPLRVVYKGDDGHAPTEAVLNVNFGERPKPALPKLAVLITPYATPQIELPFVLFYGTMWIAFIYAFGYLVLWKMRLSGASEVAAPAHTGTRVSDSPPPEPPPNPANG